MVGPGLLLALALRRRREHLGGVFRSRFSGHFSGHFGGGFRRRFRDRMGHFRARHRRRLLGALGQAEALAFLAADVLLIHLLDAAELRDPLVPDRLGGRAAGLAGLAARMVVGELALRGELFGFFERGILGLPLCLRSDCGRGRRRDVGVFGVHCFVVLFCLSFDSYIIGSFLN